LRSTRLRLELPSRFWSRTRRPVAQTLVIVLPADLVEDACPLPHPVADDLNGFGFRHRSAALLTGLHMRTLTRRVGTVTRVPIGSSGATPPGRTTSSTQPPRRDALRRRRDARSSTTNNSVSAVAGLRSPWFPPKSTRPASRTVTEPRTSAISQRYRSSVGQPRWCKGEPPQTEHRSSVMRAGTIR